MQGRTRPGHCLQRGSDGGSRPWCGARGVRVAKAERAHRRQVGLQQQQQQQQRMSTPAHLAHGPCVARAVQVRHLRLVHGGAVGPPRHELLGGYGGQRPQAGGGEAEGPGRAAMLVLVVLVLLPCALRLCALLLVALAQVRGVLLQAALPARVVPRLPVCLRAAPAAEGGVQDGASGWRAGGRGGGGGRAGACLHPHRPRADSACRGGGGNAAMSSLSGGGWRLGVQAAPPGQLCTLRSRRTPA